MKRVKEKDGMYAILLVKEDFFSFGIVIFILQTMNLTCFCLNLRKYGKRKISCFCTLSFSLSKDR
jgi:hypothetical protein